MAFVTTREMLIKAQKEHFAIGAFNVENMEMMQAVVEAAEQLNAPVIIQTTPGTLKYAPPAVFAGMAERMALASKAPIALHLDHGSSYELAEECIRNGYTSIMIDGSLLPFEENVSLSSRVVALAGALPVEAELGTVGGKEDDHTAEHRYTEPSEAALFVEKTGISSFAPAIGTAHGVYAREPKLDLDRLTEIRNSVSVPLVLHGTSGVPHEAVRACIERGICKVNYATELRQIFTSAVRKSIQDNEKAFDPKKHFAPGRDAVRERVCELIRLLGSDEKA